MPSIPCAQRNRQCLPCNDPPVLNLSAEREDRNRFLGFNFDGVNKKPLGWWGDLDCAGTWFWSDVSFEDALQHAAATICDPPPPPPPPPGGDGANCDTGACPPVPGDGYTNTTWYPNDAQTCTDKCPNGDVFTHTVEAGRVNSPLSKEDANNKAKGICWREIKELILCFGFFMPPACFGQFYEYTFRVSGGKPPYTYALNYTTVPGGVTLDPATGYFSGFPATPGHYSVQTSATDSNTPPTTVVKTWDFYVVEFVTSSLAAGSVGTAYSQTLTANGTPPVYHWTLISGSLPPGLTLNATTGVISGTPTTAGTYSFVIGIESP